MPRRLVIDTNVHVSFIFSSPDSPIKQALAYAHERHNIFQSPETFEELEEVLSRSKFKKYLSAERRNDILDSVKQHSIFVDHGLQVDVSRDPKDNKFFALAEAVDADFILSGDERDVLSILDYKNSQTISAADFMDPRNRSLHFSHQASHIRRDSGIFVPETMDAG